MAEPKKDGIDDYPTVLAEDWREAMSLGGSCITYRCPDGTEITFGQVIRVNRKTQ